MDDVSPQQQQDSLGRGGGAQENKRRLKSHSYRRQSAPSLVISKALTRSKTLSRESFSVPERPETCSLVQSFLSGSERCFLLHGHAQLKTAMQTQDRHLFLFNDILVITKAKSANHFKQKAQVYVCEMWTASCMDEVCEGSTNPERSFVMGWPTCNCVATFSSAEQKEKWLPLLKSQIKEAKEKEEPKTIPLRVYGKGINTFAVTKTLPVSNSDSTNEVIRLALQQFGIIGNVKDFQLWVISKRDNAPYPLIGHEFPFSIQMSHVKHSTSQGGGGGRDTTQVEQLQVYKQCQFILKPRPIETPQQHVSAELPQKPFKRRRSLITWAFWRGSSSHLNEPTLTGGARGRLFGQPLGVVCVEGALPKAVMDMLTFLYHEGSWTRGIFRRPAGARAVRELRDSLDTGESQLSLTRDHVFIIAGVLKDFLRSIPGSLLCCELHEEWMDVLEEEEEEEEQVQDIQRMMRRLPKENNLLFRYLLAVLHGIQGNAHENQMTSFNLSVCIAPSILWPPGAPCSPEVEGEGTKKVCELVKFMIDHCEQILGEDPSSLFGGPPQKANTEETGPDSWLYPLTDSSYDSLENELDSSSGGSPSFCSRRHLSSEPLQGSLDSILAFDYAHTEPSCSGQDGPTADTTSSDDRHTRRRRSEPAVAYVGKFQLLFSGSTDNLTAEDEEELSMKTGSHAHSTGQVRRAGGECGLNHHCGSLTPLAGSLRTPVTSSGGRSGLESSPPGGQTREALNWETLKGHRGLHPNSWLKKDLRLSVTEPDTDLLRTVPCCELAEGMDLLEKQLRLAKQGKLVKEEDINGLCEPKEEDTNKGGQLLLSGSQTRPKTSCRPSKGTGAGNHGTGWPAHKSRHLLQDSHSSGRSDVTNQKPGTQSQANELKSRSTEEERNTLLCQRRRSEPGHQLTGQAIARARLPSDPGPKVSEADSQRDTPEAHLCLSPCATKAVRDYFSSHPRSHPDSSQQVALALVQSHREWLKRCNNPTAEPDFDQLLFAEESYV
ncbi:paraspeckle component 1 isoform X2 [Mastacembelus armatus]|uniref:Paraspeckle component 1 n=1 Tax=Mastacembelus armatus TaxID=205130 RepID=A0A3Q3L9X0_9TELE|nr:paraspeckle component 1 isoform X2 [Mastacembelus armatus]